MPALRSSARYRFAMPTSGEPGRRPRRARAGAAPPLPDPTRAATGRGGSARWRPSGTRARAARAGRTPVPGGPCRRARRLPRPGPRDPSAPPSRRLHRRARRTAACRAAAARRRRRGGRRSLPSARAARAGRAAPAPTACECRAGTSVDGTKIGRLPREVRVEEVAGGDRIGACPARAMPPTSTHPPPRPRRPRSGRFRGSVARPRSSDAAPRAA